MQKETKHQQVMLLAEHFAKESNHIYENFKMNGFKIKLIKSNLFHADLILNNMPFLFVLDNNPNIKIRIKLFLKKFASNKYVIGFSNMSMYKELVLWGSAVNTEYAKNIQMYYLGENINDFKNTIIEFAKLKSEEKLSKITAYVHSVLNEMFLYTKNGLINAIAEAINVDHKEAEIILNTHRNVYQISTVSKENKSMLLELTPVDKQVIDVLYDFLTN